MSNSEKNKRIEDSSKSIFGNVSNASTNYGIEKFNARQGHGFAAERANHLFDKLSGKDVQILGDDNKPNGADRIVNNVKIQSKYCATGSRCINECFDKNTKLFRYLDSNGQAMQIEVPSDKYNDALQAMRHKIENNQVPGYSNPDDAEKLVRKGNITYEQARNIAKAGTVDSITFDAANGAIISASAFGISATVSFATSIWRGEDLDIAFKNAAFSGLKVGGTAFVTAVISSQLTRTGINSALVGSSEAVVAMMGPKAASLLVNAFRSGTNIYGAAAMKSAAKLLRGNVVTAAVSVAVLSTIDVVDIFRGRISGAQMFKNLATTAASVGAGTAGWVGGAAAGAFIGSTVPVIGTAIGGFVGGLVGSIAGGFAGGTAASKALDYCIEDDAKEMQRIIGDEFSLLANDYLLNEKETNEVANHVEKKGVAMLKDMYASSDRNNFARKMLLEKIEPLMKERKQIKDLDSEKLVDVMKEILENIADEQAS